MAGFYLTIKQIIRAFIRKDFSKNRSAPSISESRQRILAIGLINSEQITAYTNSLTTGLSKDRILQILTEAWDINDREKALNIVEWLQKEGHRGYYSKIYPLIEKSKDVRNEQLRILFEENAEEAILFANNLAECISELGNDDFAAFNDNNLKKGIYAWDLGRLVVIARLLFDIGYINEKTAWSIIDEAYKAAAKEYTSWKELAVAYLIGRGMWNGENIVLNGLYVIAKNAFKNAGSPWKYISFSTE